MTAAEMGLDHNLECYRMIVAELEEVKGQFSMVMDIIENRKQIYSDTMMLTHDTKEKDRAILQWHTLNDLQKEVYEKIGKER